MRPSGQTELTLAALIPRRAAIGITMLGCSPRTRARVTAGAGNSVAAMAPAMVPVPVPLLPAATRRRASLHWARLLARIYEIQPLTCPRCHGPMRLIAILIEPSTIRAILAHLGEPTTAPPLIPRARAPPWDPTAAAPDPGHPFDQTLT